MPHFISLLLLLFFAYGTVWGQSQLLIEHPKRQDRVSMQVGDLISLTQSEEKVRGRITHFSDSSIWITTETRVVGAQETDLRVYREEVLLSEIQSIDKQHSRSWRRFQRIYSGTTMAGGSMVILGSSVNAMATDRPPSLTAIAVTGLVLTSGLVVRMLGRRRYQRKKGWQWGVVPTPSPPSGRSSSQPNDP